MWKIYFWKKKRPKDFAFNAYSDSNCTKFSGLEVKLLEGSNETFSKHMEAKVMFCKGASRYTSSD